MLEAEAEQGHDILEEKNKKRQLAAQQAAVLDTLQLNTQILPSSILFFVPSAVCLRTLIQEACLRCSILVGGRLCAWKRKGPVRF